MVIFLEGFDSYSTSFAQWYKWDAPNTLPLTLGSGRFGTGQAFFQGGVTPKFFGNHYSGLTVGFAIYHPGDAGNIMRFWNGPSFVMDIGLTSLNALLFITGQATTITSTKPLPFNSWVYLEISIADFASTAAGNMKIRLNGEQILSSPVGFDINMGGAASGFWLYGAGGDEIGYDDLYVTNNLGIYNTDFLEDGEIITLFPNGPGGSTQFSVFGAGANWQAVIDQPNDGDTTYVFDGTIGDMDLYAIPTIPVGNTLVIPAIAVNSIARRNSSTPINCAALVQSGVNLGESATQLLVLSYSNFQGIFEREPVTNDPWTETLINSLQIGTEVVA